jgi:uncharacterized phage protein (TIGR02218 family)
MTSISEGELTSMAFCWRLERRDGAGVALTSHDQRIERGGVIYAPSPGMIPAAIVRRRGLEPQSSEIDGAVSDEALTDDDLALGRWDGARVTLEAVDWSAPDADGIVLTSGEIGPVAIVHAGFTAELVGAAVALDAPVCPTTSSECRARLGDRQCRVDLGGRRTDVVVIEHRGSRLTTNPAADSNFAAGEMVVVSGPMSGFRSPIITVEEGAVILRDPPRRAIGAGCRLWLSQGCDKTFATCRERFGNAVNFRGEPHLPGNDLLTRYPGA